MRPALPLAIAVLGLRLAPAAAQPADSAGADAADRLLDIDPTVTCRAEHAAAAPPGAPGWSLPTCPRHARLAADRIELFTPITFNLDKATLRPTSWAVLDDVAALLLAHPGLLVEIQAHASDDPDRAMRLSDRRARAVEDFLQMRGVPARQLVAHGYGADVPLVPWTAPDARRRNVRIELHVQPPPTPVPPG